MPSGMSKVPLLADVAVLRDKPLAIRLSDF